MSDWTPIAVASRSFSKHPILRAELSATYGNVRFNDEGAVLAGDQLIEFAHGRRKLIIALERIDERVLAALPELEVISKYGVGTDNLDTEAMMRHGVRLGWTGGVNRRSVAELAIALMMSVLRHIPRIDQEIRTGTWKNHTGRQLTGRTVGIIGCGQIGKEVAVLLRAFHCTVLAHDIVAFPDFYARHGIDAVGLDELLSRSDIVSLHVPVTSSTRNMLNTDRLGAMKPEALLINTARGGLVDEAALAEALKDGRIAGAGFDVFAVEPPGESPLLRAPNFIATSHIGGSTEESILAMGRAAIEGLDRHCALTEICAR